jgi:orotidine-5'-phosphate decarboxylase
VAEIAVALDLATARDALALADRLPGLRWVKIGPVLFVREGPALVRACRERGLHVFLDLKWHDIPSTVAGAVTAARELGVTMATVHCLGGPRMLEAAVRAAGDLALVGVTVLTSHDGADFAEVLGRGVPDVAWEAERLARAALRAGLRGVVASGQELSLLREALGREPWLVVPGIRLPGDPVGDQIRVIEPEQAVRLGATHLVVGRSITAADDPVRAWRRLQEVVT